MSAQDDDHDDARIVFWPAHPGGLYAVDPGRADGDLIHIEDAPRGATGLLCPECHSELVAKKGSVRAHHFAHRGAGGGEDVAACARAGETALHRLAKEIIAQEGRLHLPPVTFRTGGETRTLREAQWCAFQEVRLEPREPGMRPDLIASHHGSKGAADLAVEIQVTHRVGAKKRARFAAMDLPAIEIDLSRVDRRLDRTGLAALILHSAPRSWLFSRMAYDAQARADEEAAEQHSRRKAQEARIEADVVRQRRANEHAMRDILRDRKQARRDTPRGTDPAIRAWAAAKLADLPPLICGSAARRAGQDHPFEAEPAVWRAVVLTRLVTWTTDLGSTTTNIAVAAAAALRRKGFVKAGYRTAVPDPPGGYPSGDPVRDACREVLEAAIATTASGSLFETLEAIRSSYRFPLLIRDHLRQVATLAAARGATVTLHGKTIGEDVAWETARQLAAPEGDGHAPSPSDLRIIKAALNPDKPRASVHGRGPDPVLAAAARLGLVLKVDDKDRTAALLTDPISD